MKDEGTDPTNVRMIPKTPTVPGPPDPGGWGAEEFGVGVQTRETGPGPTGSTPVGDKPTHWTE